MAATRQTTRGARRDWWRWVVTVALLVGLLGGVFSPIPMARAASGSTITVTSPADSGGTGCTLRDALAAANADATVGGCALVANDSAEATIVFDLGGDPTWSISLLAPLPTVTVGMALRGPGAHRLTIGREVTPQGNGFRILTFAAGGAAITIAGVTLSGGTPTDSVDPI